MHQHHVHDGVSGPAPVSGDTATCPVMHIPVDKEAAQSYGLVRSYNGKTYYFCCDDCTADFDKNPKKFSNADTASK